MHQKREMRGKTIGAIKLLNVRLNVSVTNRLFSVESGVELFLVSFKGLRGKQVRRLGVCC